WAALAELFEAEPAARSTDELADWFRAERPELRAGPQARDAVRFLCNPPLPLHTRPAYALLAAAAVDLLPGWARRSLWLPAVPLVDPLAVRPATWALFRTLDWVMEAYPDPPTESSATHHTAP